VRHWYFPLGTLQAMPTVHFLVFAGPVPFYSTVAGGGYRLPFPDLFSDTFAPGEEGSSALEGMLLYCSFSRENICCSLSSACRAFGEALLEAGC